MTQAWKTIHLHCIQQGDVLFPEMSWTLESEISGWTLEFEIVKTVQMCHHVWSPIPDVFVVSACLDNCKLLYRVATLQTATQTWKILAASELKIDSPPQAHYEWSFLDSAM